MRKEVIFDLVLIAAILLIPFIYLSTKNVAIIESKIEKDAEAKRREDGRTRFAYYCALCHGLDGAGQGDFLAYALKPSPPDLTEVEYMKTLSDEHITAVISGGSLNVGKSNLCPPWGNTFNKEQVENLLLYIRSLSVPTKEPPGQKGED